MSDGATCLRCAEGLTLANEDLSCVTAAEHCAEYDRSSCMECEEGYVFADEDAPTCVRELDCCKTYHGNGTCKRCQPGYAVTATGLCEPKLDYCIEIDENGGCVACDSRHQLTYGYRNVSFCIDSVFGCGAYSYRGCIECTNVNFPQLVYGECDGDSCITRCVTKESHCIQYALDGICLVCDSGYSASTGRCMQYIEHCRYVSTSGECWNCDPGI